MLRLCERRQALQNESHEQQKVGSTRVVFGAGCAVKHLLIGKEFVRLNVQGLPRDFDAQRLRQLMEELCPECQVRQ